MDDEASRAAQAKAGSPFLNTKQAAHYLGLSVWSLQRMRRRGGGPLFRRHAGMVRYHVADLIAWSEANRRSRIGEAAALEVKVAPPRPGGSRHD
jgi:hypothetical protein